RAFLQGAQSEPEELLRRAEAAQRLQSSDRLRSRRVTGDADSHAGFSISRNSELGDTAGLHRRTDQLTPINTWFLLVELIAQSHGLQCALRPGPTPFLFCDR